MTHVEDSLAEYVDHQLPTSRRSGLEAHLAACGGCRDAAENVRRAHEALRTLEMLSPSPDFLARVTQKLEDARVGVTPQARGHWIRSISIAAGIALLAVAALLWRSSTLPPPAQFSLTEYLRQAEGRYPELGSAALATPAPGARPADPDELADRLSFRLFRASPIVGRYDLRATYWIPGRDSQLVQLVYSDGRESLIIFQLPATTEVALGEFERSPRSLEGFGSGAGYVTTPHFQMSRLFSEGTKLLIVRRGGADEALLRAVVRDLGCTLR